MEDKKIDNNNIRTVLVTPVSHLTYKYLINEESPHSGNFDAVYKFLLDLLPYKGMVFRDLLSRFRNFIVIVDTKDIIELSYDYDKNLRELKLQQKELLFKDNYLIEEKNKLSGIDKNNIEEKLESISKINLKDKFKIFFDEGASCGQRR